MDDDKPSRAEVRRVLGSRRRALLRPVEQMPVVAYEIAVERQRRELIDKGSPFAEKESPPL